LLAAERQITKFFNSLPQRVFSEQQLFEVLRQQRHRWKIADRVRVGEFLEFLLGTGGLRLAHLRSARYEAMTRYIWGEYSPHELAASLRAGSYLSHGSALFLLGLARNEQNVIYVNREQSAKAAPRSVLTQESVDRAFAREARRSNLILSYERRDFVLLSGKNTNRHGVGAVKGPAGQLLPVTNLTRTLIDITVRPEYAGGPASVLAAYREARGRVIVANLVDMLAALDYAYPFHQAIGFYMARAGYSSDTIRVLRSSGLSLDFYLAHGLIGKGYDPEWRIFYPRDLE
jgi:hypothetical protein